MGTYQAIELNNLVVRYQQCETPALSINSLTIPRGKLIGVIGPSGSGKSTLLRAIAGFIKPASGEIRFNGRVVANNDFPKHLSVVYQNFNLMRRLDVLTNVLMGRLAHQRGFNRVWTKFSEDDRYISLMALDRVGMLPFASSTVQHLSGGQMQRIAIARCLAQQTPIILADEPVAALDPINANNVITLLLDLCREQNITVLVNLHQVDLVQEYCDAVIGLKAGKVGLTCFDLKQNVGTLDWARLYS